MDRLHAVLRTIRGGHKAHRDHLAVFREFLDHLDRTARRKHAQRVGKSAKGRARRRR